MKASKLSKALFMMRVALFMVSLVIFLKGSRHFFEGVQLLLHVLGLALELVLEREEKSFPQDLEL